MSSIDDNFYWECFTDHCSFPTFLHLTGLKLNGLDVSEHVQPEEGHHPDEANSEPGGDEHEVHELKKVSSRTHISWAVIFTIFSCVHKARFIVHQG